MRWIKYIYRYYRMLLLRFLASCYGRKLNLPDRVLVVAPHPDDEIMGCGGIIQNLHETGKEVSVVVMTGGEKSHGGCCDLDEALLKEKRRELTRMAAGVIHAEAEHIYFLNFQDSNINVGDQEVLQLKSLVEHLQPQAILVPHFLEGWPDHIHAGEIIGQIAEDKDIRILEYCVWFWYNPYYSFSRIPWKNALVSRMTKREYLNKREAIRVYMDAKAPCGKPYSGVLPSILLKANQWRNELFFEKR